MYCKLLDSWGHRYTRVMRCGVVRADLVVVSKKKREMLLLRGESVLRTYRIALGPEPAGPVVGRARTPYPSMNSGNIPIESSKRAWPRTSCSVMS